MKLNSVKMILLLSQILIQNIYSLNFDINETPPKSDPALSFSDSDTCHSKIDGMYIAN